jgi:glycosyltransferase involved in cell wall biosynthesis
MNNIKILFFWEGFPPCALLLTELKNKFGSNLTILGTKAKVSFPDFDKEYPHLDIKWLDYPNQIWDLKHIYLDNDVVVHTGWAHAGWLKFSKYMKKRNKKIYFTVDNIYNGSIKQIFGYIYFRLFLKDLYDGVFVPGNLSRKFLIFLGMPINKIYCGYYGAYESLYYSNNPIIDRNNEFLFVGQLVERKGLITLINAFKIYRLNGGQWNLRITGSGPLESICQGEGIIFEKFLNPKECSIRMRNSKCLILPSFDEHWGTVVCEAAASGMAVILSDKVGSNDDILRNGINGFLFKTGSILDLSNKLKLISSWDNCRLTNAHNVSKSISKAFDSNSFYNGFYSMIES